MTDPDGSDGPPVAPDGIDVPRVSAWFADNIPGAAPPLSFRLIAGGRSNLTFEVADAAGGRFVLRRPPAGHLLPTAHDMAREHRIIAALGPAGIPVAPALGLCEDPAVNGAPFYVMRFVDGHIPRTAAEARTELSADARAAVGPSLVDTLAAIHAVDPDRVGLGDLGRKDGYVGRQLRRWYAQYCTCRDDQGGPDVPDVDEVHDELVTRVPEQGPAAIVHGDYRVDNCVLDDAGTVRAVLDWELCTLGDPLADLGQLVVYWSHPGERPPLGESPTSAEGFCRRDELIARYGERTGRDTTAIGFYVAFAYWKLACIMAGVHTRYVAGAMGADGFDASATPDTVAWLARRAADAAAALA